MHKATQKLRWRASDAKINSGLLPKFRLIAHMITEGAHCYMSDPDVSRGSALGSLSDPGPVPGSDPVIQRHVGGVIQ